MKHARIFSALLLTTLLVIAVGRNYTLYGIGTSDASPPPAHSQLARELLEGVLPEDNSYQHHPSIVECKGEKGAKRFICHTDCSGLIDALFSHAYGYTPEDFKQWTGKKRSLSSSYNRAICQEHGFTKITTIQQLIPGDLISYKLPPGSKNFGHVMLVDERPKEIKSRAPFVSNTTQWSVAIIDCTGHGHGLYDTRYLGDGHYHAGIGRGELRLYANPEGYIIGYAWSILPKSKYYDAENRHLVIGRLIPNFRP